jgi:hypothetical protein
MVLISFEQLDTRRSFDPLQQQKIKPLIARRFPLVEARQAQELLGKGVIGKIVLTPPLCLQCCRPVLIDKNGKPEVRNDWGVLLIPWLQRI